MGLARLLLQPVGDAQHDRVHVLHRRADLNAHFVVRGLDAVMLRAGGARELHGDVAALASEDRGRRLAGRALVGLDRPGDGDDRRKFDVGGLRDRTDPFRQKEDLAVDRHEPLRRQPQRLRLGDAGQGHLGHLRHALGGDGDDDDVDAVERILQAGGPERMDLAGDDHVDARMRAALLDRVDEMVVQPRAPQVDVPTGLDEGVGQAGAHCPGAEYRDFRHVSSYSSAPESSASG